MERLTYWNEEYECWSYHGPSGEAAKRLTAYEGTGLEPEEINAQLEVLRKYSEAADGIGLKRLRELAQAEKDGRLVVMPCNAVYIPTWDAGEKCDLACPVSIDGSGWCDICDKAELFIYMMPCRQEHIEQIGKTVFLTREEAEAAMKMREEGCNHA